MHSKPENETSGIVVGIDGSPGSRAALEWAMKVDPALGEVIPVAAWNLPWWTATLAGAAAPVRYYQMEHDVDVMLDEVVESLGSDRLGDRIVAQGGATTVLLDAAKGQALLVVGSRGHGAMIDTILGSVGIACSLRATTPMAVVPNSASSPGGPCVVGVDSSDNSLAALIWAMKHAPEEAPVVAVNAWRPPVYPGVELPEEAFTDIERHSQSVLDAAIASACEVMPAAPVPKSQSRCGDARTVLEAAAKEAAMLAVGARGDGGFSGIVLGSVTTALLHRPVCPTIVVPAPLDRNTLEHHEHPREPSQWSDPGGAARRP